MLVALTVQAASASELRGNNNQQFDISVESFKTKCDRETILTLICNNAGGAMSEMVDMSCGEAKKAAPGRLRDFCGRQGGSWNVKCHNSCDPSSGVDGGGGKKSSIACMWSGSGFKRIDCPGDFASKYSENYTCDNGMHICKYNRRFLCCFLLILMYLH